MNESYLHSQKQFAAYMQSHEQESAPRPSNNDPYAEKKEHHAKLAPMKETLRKAGIAFSTFSGHLKKNGAAIGAPKFKKESLLWAADLHDEDPDNFIKNVGL